MRCSVCGVTNCQNGADCMQRIARRNKSSKCFYVSIVLGFALMISGILTFIFAFCVPAAPVDITVDLTLATIKVSNPTEKLSNSAEKVDHRLDKMDKNDDNPKSYFNENTISFIIFALFVFFTGLLVTINGLRLDHSSSNSTTIYQTEQANPVELRPLNRCRNSVQVSSDPQTSDTQSANPYSSHAQSSNTSSRNSKGRKRSSSSSDHDKETEEFIPKISVPPVTAKSPRRSGPEKSLHYYPPKDVNSLVLFPVGYPNVTCNNEILAIVHRIIDDSGLNLSTQYITLEEKYIKITHLTNSTRVFFQRTDSNSFIKILQSEIRMNMRIEDISFFARRIIMSCKMEEPIDDADFLQALNTENDIDTSRWTIGNCEILSDGFMIYFGVTPMCFQQIKDKDYLLAVNHRLVKITSLQNPYPGLFNGQ